MRGTEDSEQETGQTETRREAARRGPSSFLSSCRLPSSYLLPSSKPPAQGAGMASRTLSVKTMPWPVALSPQLTWL